MLNVETESLSYWSSTEAEEVEENEGDLIPDVVRNHEAFKVMRDDLDDTIDWNLKLEESASKLESEKTLLESSKLELEQKIWIMERRNADVEKWKSGLVKSVEEWRSEIMKKAVEWKSNAVKWLGVKEEKLHEQSEEKLHTALAKLERSEEELCAAVEKSERQAESIECFKASIEEWKIVIMNDVEERVGKELKKSERQAKTIESFNKWKKTVDNRVLTGQVREQWLQDKIVNLEAVSQENLKTVKSLEEWKREANRVIADLRKSTDRVPGSQDESIALKPIILNTDSWNDASLKSLHGNETQPSPKVVSPKVKAASPKVKATSRKRKYKKATSHTEDV